MHSLFGVLTDDELRTIGLHKGCNCHKSSQILVHEGDYPSGIYCINSGKVKLAKIADGGREHIVRLAKEGDVVGYRALLCGTPYEATATVIEDASICFVPRQTFNDLMARNPALTARVIRLLGRDLVRSEDRQVSLAQKTVRERLAETLLSLKEFFGFEADQKTLRSRLSREDLAGLVGTVEETVIRVLAELSREGVIGLRGKEITILDPGRLRKVANLSE
jgi:CRP/FNR family transcriptional regulator